MHALILALALVGPTTPSAPVALPRAQIEAAAAYSRANGGISMLVMQNGRVLFEEYPNGGAADRASELASGTKSFSGVMALCAVEDGLLSLDDRVSDTITEWKGDPRRERITIGQLLQLVSGLPGNPPGQIGQRVPTYDAAVKVPANADPGTRFQYGPVPFQVFGEVMRRKLAPRGEGVLEYMERRIFRPIGLKHGRWRRGSDGQPHLPSGAALTAREWAKFGEMVRLDGRGVLAPGRAAALFQGSSTRPGYGLTWWLPGKGSSGADPRQGRELPDALPPGLGKDIAMAAGAGGQRLYLVPSSGLVVVRQAPVLLARGGAFRDAEFLARLLAPRS